MPLGQQTEQRPARDLRHRIPHRHVDRAHRDRAITVAARLLVGHQAGPDAIRIEILAGVIEQRARIRLQQPGREALTDQPALTVAAIGVEAVADHAASVALDVGHHRHQTRGHLREVDIRVADRRADRLGDLTHVDDAHWHGGSLAAQTWPFRSARAADGRRDFASRGHTPMAPRRRCPPRAASLGRRITRSGVVSLLRSAWEHGCSRWRRRRAMGAHGIRPISDRAGAARGGEIARLEGER